MVHLWEVDRVILKQEVTSLKQLQNDHRDDAEKQPTVGKNTEREHRMIQRAAIEKVEELTEYEHIDRGGASSRFAFAVVKLPFEQAKRPRQ